MHGSVLTHLPQAGPVAAGEVDFQKLLECAICCDYLQQVNETPCCHNLFCKSCLVGWSKSNSSCPGCRAKLQIAACLANIPIQRFVDSLPSTRPRPIPRILIRL